jgi:glycine cleavage system aminomethyltransferase T
MVVSPTGQATRDFDWLRRNLEDDVAVVTDVTSAYSTLAVMGPESRRLLQRLAPLTDLGHDAFPFSSWQHVDMGMAKIRATRISYVGELGFELTIPTECTCHVYDAIFNAAKGQEQGQEQGQGQGQGHGQGHGQEGEYSGGDGDDGSAIDVRNAGTYAIESLRIEKGYRAWGHDLDVGVTPLEAGLGFAVAFDKHTATDTDVDKATDTDTDTDVGTSGGVEFIGRAALVEQKRVGLQQRLVTFMVRMVACGGGGGGGDGTGTGTGTGAVLVLVLVLGLVLKVVPVSLSMYV